MADILYMKKQKRKTSYPLDYRSLFRFKKENVHWLATHFLGDGTCKDYVSRIQKMKICLRYFAESILEDGIAKEVVIIDSTISKMIKKVIVSINAKADNWVKFPQTAAHLREARNAWSFKNNFPNAIGVVGCVHIRLQKSRNFGEAYVNQDGVNALNVLATCDGRELFTSVDSRWPGSTEVARIWKNSIIRQMMDQASDTLLLADDEFESEPWLMTPFKHPNHISKIKFNKFLKKERVVIDRCFDQLVSRFPILECVPCVNHEMVSNIISACFVLHNIAKYLGEEDFQGDVPDVRLLSGDNKTSFKKFKYPKTSNPMMSNTSSTGFGNNLQQHNLKTAIDYLHQNAPTSLATYPNVTTTEGGVSIMDKQTTATYFAPAQTPATFYSTQLVTPSPGTILITNNYGPEESSAISGVNSSFNNSSIRIVTHNSNGNHTNNNNNNTKQDCKMNVDKQQHYHHLHHVHHQPAPLALQHPTPTTPPNPVKMPNSQVTASSPVPTTTSTVVLDRINICINNHYGDIAAIPPSASPQSGALSGPIISPLIMGQRTTLVDTVLSCVPTRKLVDPCFMDMDMHNDEPDSTTSIHCHNESMPMEQDRQSPEHEKCIIFDIFRTQKFEIGEDALVKRRDGRYYLGTVVDIHRQQYLVQFDDKTDYWSNVDELMKLNTDVVGKEKPTCLACKRENDDDIVEICERCGRGYHRQCTDEVSSKSGEWMCKRCMKPMKCLSDDELDETLRLKIHAKVDSKKVIKQFPYAVNSLTWDEKHRVNLEQIYCYCGKSGQFDNNMIQCCKCKQWFHAHCVECVKTLFRGDVFFIFGCSVCNDGKEFLRRIEMKWVDLAHLVLYNMAIMKNFQKYHHLYKDIYPFALEKRTAFQLPISMLNLSDSEFKANLLKTLQAHPKLFQCGKEIKKDLAFWGLRANKPPQGLTYDVKRGEVLCNQLIREKFKINILPCLEEEEDEEEEEEECSKTMTTDVPQPSPSPPKEILALDDDDDDKFTSDDEIPIKLILEKVKTSNSALEPRETKPQAQNVGLNVQSNDHRTEEKEKKEKKEKKEDSTVAKLQQKSSRKRKAFTLSKGYKDTDKSNDLPRNICDSSSDENSSSSRGTLDLIIPPPKNFLGINNPFRIVTPKKSDNAGTGSTKSGGSSCITKKTVSFSSNSIFNNTLDLNSKIAALKSSGLFPNISNSDIAKAAGQPRLVRTIKRRLSAKDIMIGPNQEVRRRRTRPLSSNVEVISTTTINPIPSNFFPIRATIPDSTNTTNSSKPTTTSSSQSNAPHITSSTSSNVGCIPAAAVTTHGRRLRKRPEKTSPENSRRNSISSSSSNSSATQLALPPPSQSQNAVHMSDLKQSVNKYFGAANRIENGENFNIRAKRRLNNGQMQYLIEWES